MKQPAISSSSSSSTSMERASTTSPVTLNQKQMGQKRKLPTAQELITHYEAKGMESKEAASRVIDDLQRALFKVVTSSSSGKKNEFSSKVDMINAGLVRLESKVDSKPGFGGSFAIGLATGAALSGLGNVLPHVCHAVGQMWTTVVRSTSSSGSSS